MARSQHVATKSPKGSRRATKSVKRTRPQRTYRREVVSTPNGPARRIHRKQSIASKRRVAEAKQTGAHADLIRVIRLDATYRVHEMFPTKPRLSGRGAPPTFPDKFKITVYLLLSGDQPKVDAREILLWDVRAREGLRQGCASMGITPESYPELFDEDGYIDRLPSRRTLDRCAEKYPELSLMQSAVRKSAVDGAIHANILNGENSDPTWENVLYQDGTVLRPATSNTVPNTIDQHGNVRPARTCARVGEFIEGGKKGTRHGVKVVMTHARTPDYKQSFVTGFDFLHTMDPEAEIAQAVTLAEKFLTDLRAKKPQSRALALVSDGAGKGEAHRRLTEQGIALINVPPPLETKKDKKAGTSQRIREYEYTVNLATPRREPSKGFPR